MTGLLGKPFQQAETSLKEKGIIFEESEKDDAAGIELRSYKKDEYTDFSVGVKNGKVIGFYFEYRHPDDNHSYEKEMQALRKQLLAEGYKEVKLNKEGEYVTLQLEHSVKKLQVEILYNHASRYEELEVFFAPTEFKLF